MPELRTDGACDLFSGVGADTREHLLARAETEILSHHTLIVSEGDRLDHLHVVRQGVVELSAGSEQCRATIALLEPGDPFILAAVVRDAPALMTARAMGRAEVMRFPAGLFRRRMRQDPALLNNVTDELGRGFRGMVRHLRDQKLRSTDQRLAAYLVRLNLKQGGGGIIRLSLKKHVIASLLGMKPASLSRAFSDLQDFGVRVHGDVIEIANPEVLIRYARMAEPIDIAECPAARLEIL